MNLHAEQPAVHPAYEPLLRACHPLLLKSEEIAKHWRYHVQSVHNMRRLGTGPAYLRIGNAVRYRLSEIMRHEIAGHSGPLTMGRISLALATLPGLEPEQRRMIEAHLQATLEGPAGPF